MIEKNNLKHKKIKINVFKRLLEYKNKTTRNRLWNCETRCCLSLYIERMSRARPIYVDVLITCNYECKREIIIFSFL